MSAISPTTRRWMSPPPHYDMAHTASHEGTTLTPYLTLPYILSLTWLAYPIISLLFVAFRLSISSSSAQDSVDDAKANLLASCAAAERAATTAVSLPRYMAVGTNKMMVAAVNGMMNAARATLVLALTMVEAIINFVISIYRSTFLCFLELIVRGGLAVVIGAVNEINEFLTGTFQTIRSTIQDSVSSINSAIQSAVNGINDINPFGDISAPQFDVPDLSVLDNVTLPDSIQQGLSSLNSSLPTVDQLKDTIKDFINTPFEELKADINNTFAGLDFNDQALFVPGQQTISFCNDMDTSVVDDLGRDLVKITRIGIILIVVLALLLLTAHCALEWYKWRCLRQHLEYTRQAWSTDPTMNNAVRNGETPTMRLTNHNLLVLGSAQQHPLLTRISNQLAALLKLTPSQHTNLQWFFHYIFHPPVLVVFIIGFFGLLSVQIQLLAIHPIERKYNDRVASSVSDFSNTIATSMNASMYNQSAFYAEQINNQVNSTQTTINDGLFGWVNGTTTTLNDTLNEFYSDLQNAVSTVFNGTVLNDPLQEFLRCLIGSKIENIENALTFLHDNLVINIPQMNESALVLSQADVDEASRPIAAAAVGDGSDENQGLVAKLIARYVESLKKERLMFLVFLGLWGFVVLVALLIILWHTYGKPKFDARRQRKFRNTQRDFSSFVTPYKPDGAGIAPAPAPAYTDTTEKAAGTGEKKSHLGGFFTINLRSKAARTTTAEHQHQRSWDSLLDSGNANNNGRDNDATQAGPSTSKWGISRPRKLMAIGHKAGRERFVSDEERDRMREDSSNDDIGGHTDVQESGWMKRLTNAFRGKFAAGNDSESSFTGTGGTQSSAGTANKPRQRPNLTIRTSLSNAAFANVSRGRLPTAGEAPPAGYSNSPRVRNNPPSAWSISPQPPKTKPWLPNPANTAGKRMKGRQGGGGVGKKPRLPGLPASPRPLGAPAAGPSRIVPGAFSPGVSGSNAPIWAFPMPATPRVAVTVGGAAARAQAQTTTPFTARSAQSGVPSYYHSSFANHHASSSAAARLSLLPENTLAATVSSGGRHLHKRTSSVPLLNGLGASSKSTRARSSSVGTNGNGNGNMNTSNHHDDPRNPFRTPFDDDAMVIPENWPQPPSSTSMGNGARVNKLNSTPTTGRTPISAGATSNGNPFSPRAL